MSLTNVKKKAFDCPNRSQVFPKCLLISSFKRQMISKKNVCCLEAKKKLERANMLSPGQIELTGVVQNTLPSQTSYDLNFDLKDCKTNLIYFVCVTCLQIVFV